MANEDVLKITKGVVTECDRSAKNVVIPDGVTEIGERAFSKCWERLESVVIPKSVTKIDGSAFYGCGHLKSVVIGEGVTEIGEYAFMGCHSLESVVIPDSVKQIGSMAFQDCAALKSIVIPKNVEKMENETFNGCYNLESVEICGGVTEVISWDAFTGCHALKSVVIGEGVKRILSDAFCECIALKSLVLPSTLTHIDKSAFKDCNDVEEIVSASPLFPFDEQKGILYDATSQKKVTLITSAKAIAKKAKIEQVQKAGATAVLESILSEHHVEDVQVRNTGNEQFVAIPAVDGGIEVCLGDANVSKWMQTLPVLLDKANANGSAKELREYAKANGLPDSTNKHLKISQDGSIKLKKDAKPVHIAIPDGVVDIGDLFNDCKSLVSVALGEGMTEIGNNAFRGCKSLSSVEFGGTRAQWEAVNGKQWLLEYVPAKTVECTDGEVSL